MRTRTKTSDQTVAAVVVVVVLVVVVVVVVVVAGLVAIFTVPFCPVFQCVGSFLPVEENVQEGRGREGKEEESHCSTAQPPPREQRG